MPLKKKGKKVVISNDIKVNWDVLNDVKTELREVHKKLTTYSGSQKNYSEFDSNKIPSYTRETQSYNNFVSTYDDTLLSNVDMMKQENLFDDTNNTIQGGDPSLYVNSKYKFDTASLLSLNNDYDKLLEENYMELKMKCLNDLNMHDQVKTGIRNAKDVDVKENRTKKQHLTFVDVKVPSMRRRASGSTNNLRKSNEVSQQLHKKFQSERRLDKENGSLRNGSSSKTNLGMENNNRLNQQNIPPSTPTGAPLINKRTLHRDDDLLPFSQNSPDIYNSKFSSLNKPSKLGSNITKRHLAGSTNQNNNYEEIVNHYASASLSKINKSSQGNDGKDVNSANANNSDKPNRKIAVLTNSNLVTNYKYKGAGNSAIVNSNSNNQNNDYEEFLVDSKSQTAFGVQSTGAFSKTDKEQIDRISKKLKKIESESLNNFDSVPYNQNFYSKKDSMSKLGATGSTGNPGGQSNGLITPGSWRIGEALVQKQLKQHLRQQQQQKQQQNTVNMDRMNMMNSMKMTSEGEDHGIQMTKKSTLKKIMNDEDRRTASSNHSPNIKLKRTDCHLIQKNLLPTNQSAPAAVSPNPSRPSASGFSKAKPYDINDVHKYMQIKKTKRIYETKSEKEKQKREDEERKKKLAELYRKQRSQTTVPNSGVPNSDNLIPVSRTKSAKPSKNESSSSNEYHEANIPSKSSIMANAPKVNRLYEQDMSKILLDKITHLLNDNDKLVEKQRKQLHHSKSINQKVLTQTGAKRVDFAESTKDKQHMSEYTYNENEFNEYYEEDMDQEEEYSDAEQNYEANVEQFSNNSKSGNANNETSLNYSASSTLTPSAFHSNNRSQEMSQKRRNLSNEDLSHLNMGQPQNYKHDRLKKICTMALDLQTKLQQTKLKLFGMNPNDETMIYYDKNMGNENEMRDYQPHRKQQNDYSKEDNLFNTENLISFEKVFKQQVKEQQQQHGYQSQQNDHYIDKYSGFNRSHSPLPGTVDFRTRIKRLTQDEAARKIQRAFRSYLTRRQTKHQSRYYNVNSNRYEPNKHLENTGYKTNNISIQKHVSELKDKQSGRRAKEEVTSLEFRGNNDDYNFINIFKKRGGGGSTTSGFAAVMNVQAQSRYKLGKITSQHEKKHITEVYEDDYSEDFTTTKKKEVKMVQPELNKSSLSTVSSSSSSSDSTSLSKYMLSINSQILPKKTSASHESISKSKSANKTSAHNTIELANNENNESLSSNESISSKVSSNSSSSHSTTLSMMSHNKSGNKSKLITPPASASQHISLSSKSNRNEKSGLKESSLKFLKRNKIIPSEDATQKELRYSPTSLEHLLKAGINYLDTLNTSAVQLEELDKIRCIGLAQQDTVALAHLIKDQQNQAVQSVQKTEEVVRKPVSKSYDTSDFESTEETYESKINKTKSERSASARPTRAATTKNNLRAVSLSSTFSSSSYSDSNDNTETDTATAAKKNLSIQDRTKTHDDHDASLINTISEINSEKKGSTGDEDDELEKSFRQLLPSESHLKKNKLETNRGDQSLLYMNDMSQTSFSQLETNQPSIRISFEDDSFKKFTGEIVKKYMQEEEMRSKHQAHLLKLREKALVDKTTAELTWLEQMKKKVQDKGEDEKMPSILKKEKGIMQKLKEEQDNINQMKEVQRKATENRLKILSQHSEVIKWCQNKLKKQSHNSGQANTYSAANTGDTSLRHEAASNENEIEDEESHNQLDESTINQSLIESKIMKQVKQHLNSEKYLTEREKKLRLRRKHAEEIIAWKKKLDDEELQVREIEKKANLVLSSKSKDATEAKSVSKPQISSKLRKTEEDSKSISTHQKIKADHSYSESFIPTQLDKSEITTKLKTINTASSNSENTSSLHTTTSRTTSISSTTSNIHSATINTKIDTKVHDSDDSSIKTNIDDIIETMNNIDEDINESFDATQTQITRSKTKDTKTTETDNLSSSSSSVSTTNTAGDLEKKVKMLKSELIQKKTEAEKLKQTLKLKEKTKLKEKEEFLRKKINSYDSLIGKIKGVLDTEQEQLKIKTKEEETTRRKKTKSVSTIQTDQFEEDQSEEDDKTNEFSVTHDDRIESKVPTEINTQYSQDEDETEDIKTSMHEINSEARSHSKSESSEATTESSKVKEIDVRSKKSSESSGSGQKTMSTNSTNQTSGSNKYDDDDFIVNSETTSNKSREPSLKETKPELFDDEKSTVSEISEDIMVESTIDKSTHRSKAGPADPEHSQAASQFDSESSNGSSSSSTDTQILLLNRTPRAQEPPKTETQNIHDQTLPDDDLSDQEFPDESEATTSIGTKVQRENTKQNNRVADSIEDAILSETISQMIKIRESKIQKLEKNITDEDLDTEVEQIENYNGQEDNERDEDPEESNNLKIYIPSINLEDEPDQDGSNKSQSTARRANDLKEKIANLKIPYKKEKIDRLTETAIGNYFWQRLSRNDTILLENVSIEDLVEDEDLKDFFKSDRDSVVDAKPEEDTAEIEMNFKRMLLDLIGELLYDLYLEKYEKPSSVSNFFPAVKKTLKKTNFKSIIRGPMAQVEAQKLVKTKVNQILKLAVSTESFLDAKPEINPKSKWRSNKKLDLVDNLLDTEMREQEHEWSNYELEEYEAKLLISNTIFDMLLKDTVDCFQLNMLKKLQKN